MSAHPKLHPSNTNIFVDCPGMLDSRDSTQSIANFMSIKMLTKRVKNVKILCVISKATIGDTKGYLLTKKLSSIFQSMFKQNTINLKQAVHFVITKDSATESDFKLVGSVKDDIREKIEYFKKNIQAQLLTSLDPALQRNQIILDMMLQDNAITVSTLSHDAKSFREEMEVRIKALSPLSTAQFDFSQYGDIPDKIHKHLNIIRRIKADVEKEREITKKTIKSQTHQVITIKSQLDKMQSEIAILEKTIKTKRPLSTLQAELNKADGMEKKWALEYDSMLHSITFSSNILSPSEREARTKTFKALDFLNSFEKNGYYQGIQYASSLYPHSLDGIRGADLRCMQPFLTSHTVDTTPLTAGQYDLRARMNFGCAATSTNIVKVNKIRQKLKGIMTIGDKKIKEVLKQRRKSINIISLKSSNLHCQMRSLKGDIENIQILGDKLQKMRNQYIQKQHDYKVIQELLTQSKTIFSALNDFCYISELQKAFELSRFIGIDSETIPMLHQFTSNSVIVNKVTGQNTNNLTNVIQ